MFDTFLMFSQHGESVRGGKQNNRKGGDKKRGEMRGAKDERQQQQV